jgi:hypothetical protein
LKQVIIREIHGTTILRHRHCEDMECGGKRSATPLWGQRSKLNQQKRRRRSALPAHSKWWHIQESSFPIQVLNSAPIREIGVCIHD